MYVYVSMYPSLPPAIPLLWEGLVDMPGTVSFTSSAYPVSGSTDYVATVSKTPIIIPLTMSSVP